MPLTSDLGVGAWGYLIVGAFVIGVVAQWLGIAEGEDDWLPVMAGALVGAFIASEWIPTQSGLGPVWDGLAIGPAVTGGAVAGGIAALVTLVVTGGAHPNDGRHA